MTIQKISAVNTLLSIPWWISGLLAAFTIMLPELLHILDDPGSHADPNPLFGTLANVLSIGLATAFMIITLLLLWKQFSADLHRQKERHWLEFQHKPSQQNHSAPHISGAKAGENHHTPLKPTAWSLELLQAMADKPFQSLCQMLFGELNLDARLPAAHLKRSLDIELYDKETPWKLIAIAQCKIWSDPVKVCHIKALHRVMLAKKAAKAYFITSGSFTETARNHAGECGLTLVDGQRLLQLMKALSPEKSAHLLKLVTAGDFTRPDYPDRANKLLTRKTSGSIYQVWGGTNPPRDKPAAKPETATELE